MFDRWGPDPDEFDIYDALDLEMDLETGSASDDWPAELDFSDLDLYGVGEPPELMLDVPYVPTDERTVESLLELAQVGRNDVLYDLGCGDGRIVITAAMKRGARGVGVDLDPVRVDEARILAFHSRVENMTRFVEADLLEVDFSEATVVSLYLLDQINLTLRPRLLEELQPGARIISHAFDMADWKPDRRLNYNSVNLYKWVVPAPFAGSWQWQNQAGDRYRITLKQKFQKISGQAWINDQPALLHRAALRGDRLALGIKASEQSKTQNFVMRWDNDRLLPADKAADKPGAQEQAGPAKRLS